MRTMSHAIVFRCFATSECANAFTAAEKSAFQCSAANKVRSIMAAGAIVALLPLPPTPVTAAVPPPRSTLTPPLAPRALLTPQS